MVQQDAIAIVKGKVDFEKEFKWADASYIISIHDANREALQQFETKYAAMSSKAKAAINAEAEAAEWPERLRQDIVNLLRKTKMLSERVQRI
jgi:formyltetrahydrofolate hydrolase